jgi:hypothetical protein
MNILQKIAISYATGFRHKHQFDVLHGNLNMDVGPLIPTTWI